MPEGPDPTASFQSQCVLIGTATNSDGGVVQSHLKTPGAYWVTTETALLIVERVLAGEVSAGFQTPAKAFGKDLILEVDGCELTDVTHQRPT
jgi:short subunit dehydrogenase-like uncharacterized protein